MPPKASSRAPRPAAVAARPDYFAYSYAALIFVGGIIGFVRAGSLISLLFGTVMGTLLGVGARRVSANRQEVVLVLVVSTGLMLVMGVRFANSGVFMPAGLIAIISFVSFVRYVLRIPT
ncbi:transmembrane proteins 14C-domain-containing protein [Geranomyces variabilis]|nr:transmembrane proteins 14C-domain-containing protein [Geranomyces variabilis]KAJ3136029.1 Transmembrane protein 14A [Geranomyces variabilis]